MKIKTILNGLVLRYGCSTPRLLRVLYTVQNKYQTLFSSIIKECSIFFTALLSFIVSQFSAGLFNIWWKIKFLCYERHASLNDVKWKVSMECHFQLLIQKKFKLKKNIILSYDHPWNLWVISQESVQFVKRLWFLLCFLVFSHYYRLKGTTIVQCCWQCKKISE